MLPSFQRARPHAPRQSLPLNLAGLLSALLPLAGMAQTANHPPTANNLIVTVLQNSSQTVTLFSQDLDGDPLSYTVATAPSHGSLTGTAPNFNYAPALNFVGQDSFTFTVSDGQSSTGIFTVTLTVQAAAVANQAPSVAFSSPANHASFTAPTQISLQVTASDIDGSIRRVDYFLGTLKLGGSTNSPFDFTWTNVPPGQFTLFAKAFDNAEGRTFSAPINITVVNSPTNPPPTSAGVVQWSAPSVSVAESGGSATFTVLRSGGVSGAVSVQFATANGSAVAGQDFTASSGTLNWADGDATPQTISIPILEDALYEGAETLQVTLSQPMGGLNFGSAPVGSVTILDNDPAPQVTLTVGQGSGGGTFAAGTTVTITADAAPAGMVFDVWMGAAVAYPNSPVTTLVMPSVNSTVTASYKAAPTYTHVVLINPILFVTQVPIVDDFTTIGSVFGNHQSSVQRVGRGGALYIRYPDGTLKNLTQAAGYGQSGAQNNKGIAVRQPSMHWSGTKAVFSMVVDSPSTPTTYWQLYEITGLGQSETPVITIVSNQPPAFNNISPCYATDERIIFTSDRPRNGQRHLYPQLDEYEEAPTVTGLWNLNPLTGDLFMMTHTPSGAFTPFVDSFGRVIFTRWDHLQRDQQADTDFETGGPNGTYGTFNYADESATSLMLTNNLEVFPEPRTSRKDLLAGTNLRGINFNQFFPWMINEDGTEEETLNHVGRHEFGNYMESSFTDDPNLQIFYDSNSRYNTNSISAFLQAQEDPLQPGLYYGIDAPEFSTHASGQIVSINGAPSVNPDVMRVTHVTHHSTASYTNGLSTPSPYHSGMYRNPLPLSDGTLVAVHAPTQSYETGPRSTTASIYQFRLKTLKLANGYYVSDQILTPGITNSVSLSGGNANVSFSGVMWELDPVEVRARVKPVRPTTPLHPIEGAIFAEEGVDIPTFQHYLRQNNLALLISRNLTVRDRADKQQPFNLRVAGTTNQTVVKPGKIYDIALLQFFQADQLRGLHFNTPASPRAGRRVLAQTMHEPVVDNPPLTTPLAGSVKLGPDGSMAALVPARRAMTWQLTDPAGTGVVRERYWLTFQPGEIRTCTACHGVNARDQASHEAPTNSPAALRSLLQYWKAQNLPQVGSHQVNGSNYLALTFKRKLAATNLTQSVEISQDLTNWFTGLSYSGNTALSSSGLLQEVSRSGTNTETVVVRDSQPLTSGQQRFLRVRVAAP